MEYKLVENNEIVNIAIFENNADGSALAASLGYVPTVDGDAMTVITPVITWDDIRKMRDELLLQSDWTQNRDVNLSNNSEWVTYRQALRDITDTYTSPDDVVWPTKP